MIPVTTGPEPSGLQALRDAEVRRLRNELQAGASLSSALIGREYAGPSGSFRTLLRERQHYKCCWCEHREQDRNRDVEHYRPKALATGSDGVRRDGYWWLAWTWSNLYFACDGCNRFEKGSHFPLQREARRLRPEQQPPGREAPLLLDPGSPTPHPVEHVQFRRSAPGREQWAPYPRGGSRLGATTIRLLALDRDELVDLYSARAADLRPELNALRHLATSRDRGFPRRWTRATRRWLTRSQEFCGLAYDLLDDAVPRALRRVNAADLPLP